MRNGGIVYNTIVCIFNKELYINACPHIEGLQEGFDLPEGNWDWELRWEADLILILFSVVLLEFCTLCIFEKCKSKHRNKITHLSLCQACRLPPLSLAALWK